MNNPIGSLNKIFDSRIRLGVMSILIVNDSVSFNELKQLLELTDGNLASHLNTLEQAEYLKVQKKVSKKQYAEHLQLDEKKAQRQLSKFKDLKLVKNKTIFFFQTTQMKVDARKEKGNLQTKTKTPNYNK